MKALAWSGPKVSNAEISLNSVTFRGFTLDLATGELRRGRRAIHLRPRAARALVLLVSRAGAVVGLEEFRTAIWGDGVVEWRAGLHQLVRELRKALDHKNGDGVIIETVSRCGYRFRATVQAARANRISMQVSRRDYAFVVAGVLLVPLIVLAVCISIGAK